jgi:hypothetical protein
LIIVAVAVVVLAAMNQRFLKGMASTRAPIGTPHSPERVVRIPEPAGRTVTQGSVEKQTTYRCVVDGRLVYAGPEDCRASIGPNDGPRQPPVPPAPLLPAPSTSGLSEYQRDVLRSADARIARDEANARAEMLACNAQSGAKGAGGECSALEQEIRSLDAWARQPNGGVQQDWIREQRQQVRSRQFALHC